MLMPLSIFSVNFKFLFRNFLAVEMKKVCADGIIVVTLHRFWRLLALEVPV